MQNGLFYSCLTSFNVILTVYFRKGVLCIEFKSSFTKQLIKTIKNFNHEY